MYTPVDIGSGAALRSSGPEFVNSWTLPGLRAYREPWHEKAKKDHVPEDPQKHRVLPPERETSKTQARLRPPLTLSGAQQGLRKRKNRVRLSCCA